MVKSGIIFAGILFVLAVFFALPANPFSKVVSAVLAVLGIFVIFFFRDPPRKIVRDADIILAPADGRVMYCGIEDVKDYGKAKVVKIFLSIFNVHIQRAPIEGKIINIEKKSGLYKPAYEPDASDLNAKNTIIIENSALKTKVIQITGLIARRIECWVGLGQNVSQGDKIGFIRFGSQVDIILPEAVKLQVKPGDTVKAGINIIGRIK